MLRATKEPRKNRPNLWLGVAEESSFVENTVLGHVLGDISVSRTGGFNIMHLVSGSKGEKIGIAVLRPNLSCLALLLPLLPTGHVLPM